MRTKTPALSLALLGAGLASGCAYTKSLRATPPSHVLVVLKKADVPGGCVSFTIPQRVAVRQSDEIAWEVINAGCEAMPKVSLVFPRALIEFKNFDSYPGQDAAAAARQGQEKESGYGKPTETQPFASRGAGKVIGPKGSFKYKVKLSTGYLEDPDIDIWP